MGWERFCRSFPDCHPHEHIVGVLKADTASGSESCRHDLPTRRWCFISTAMLYRFLVETRSALPASARIISVEAPPLRSQSASPCFFNLL